MRLGQIGIQRHVEPWRSPLDPAQDEMFNGIEPDRAPL
tara:strand:+ start:7858 stop:7971 length:114 start_codon:yes stop_codon:yes gene_type:complete